jgi:hypothetical protein
MGATIAYFYDFFIRTAGTIAALPPRERVMDLWFIGLIVVLAGLTWGGIVLCERLLLRP